MSLHGQTALVYINERITMLKGKYRDYARSDMEGVCRSTETAVRELLLVKELLTGESQGEILKDLGHYLWNS